jgi:arylformamidase
MKIYDVTVAVSEAVPTFPGDPKVSVDVCASLANGDPANVSQVCFGVHTATHVDAPNHFIEGTRRVAELDLGKLVGPGRVVEIGDDVMAITAAHVECIDNVERVLFKTRNSAFWGEPEKGFRTDFTYIEPEAARLLARRGTKFVGIDYLSVERFGAGSFDTHVALLEAEVVIVEGLDLRGVPPGDYQICCLPLKIVGGTGDGAPARTILIR